MSIEIPTSRFSGNTRVIPAVATASFTGGATISNPFAKDRIDNWVDDLLQVAPGAGSIAFTAHLDPADHPCPVCGSTTQPKLVDVPNCAYWGNDYACSCGAEYDSEMSGNPEFVTHDEVSLAKGRENFAYWSTRAAPMGTQPLYGEGGDMLTGVQLPDGQRVMR